MARNRVRMVSRIPQATAAGVEAMQRAIHMGVEAGATVAQTKLDTQANERGYNLEGDIGQQYWHNGGKFFVASGTSEQWGSDPWYFRFFEYGTVNIIAMPFIRPGNRIMRKRFLEAMGPEFAGFIKASAYVPPGSGFAAAKGGASKALGLGRGLTGL